MKKKSKLLLILLSSTFALVSGAIGLTYAAYLYSQNNSVPIEYSTNTLTPYFQGGNGLASNPYIISNSQHLRNLQKLNVLGVFDSNTYFKMQDTQSQNNVFQYEGEALLPIGNEDYPFYSTFDGNGRVLKGLVVNGSQTSDIGMFGYVGMSGKITNLILDAATINVTAQNNAAGESTTNPIAKILSTTNAAPSLNITLTQKRGSTPAFFKVNKKSLAVNGVTYNLYYESLRTDLLKYNQSQDRFEVQTPFGAEDGKFYPVQLIAKTYGIVDDKVISYTAERWHINVDSTGNVDIADASAGKNNGFWKTIHNDNNPGNEPHGTYVGFFIGHLDGAASNLGLFGGTANSTVNNSKIVVRGRPVKSFSSLIGRSLNDNVYDDANASFSRKFFDFDELIKSQSTPASNFFDLPNPPTNNGNVGTYFNNITAKANAVSNYYGINGTETSYMRIYPGIKNGTATYLDENNNTVTSNAAIIENAPLSGHVYNQTNSHLIWGTSNSQENFFLRNGVWIYLSDQGGWSSLLQDSVYEARIKLTYTASGSINNRFQILYNNYNPNAGSVLGIRRNKVQNAHWEPLGNVDNIYNPADHPIVKTDDNGNPVTNRVIETELVFVMDQTKFGWNADRHPMLALGVGKTLDSSNSDFTFSTEARYNYFSNETYNYDNFKLNILTLDIFFTSVNGELSRQITNVDYLYSIPTYSNGKWSNWNKDTMVKVNFEVTAQIISTSESATYRYYRTGSNFLTSTNVYVYYTVSRTAWAPQNTDGFTTASLNNG